ncbi:MAG: efflux transporter outer membrane subunit [Betaproteobacteria bacterium]|nr:MAG: efflux transporter outer membrane subunit [Betaproteobacteria bacterium]
MRNSNRIAVALSGLVTALLVAGCAVGPTHLAPAESVIAATAPQWQAGTALAKPQLENVRATEFWARWNDPSLQSLIDSAMTSAASVEAAQARIAQARAGVGVARSAMLPVASAETSATRADQGQGAASVFSGAAQAAWELDLFGGNRRGREAAAARLEARERDLDDIRVSLAADIATVYVNLRVSEALLAGFERDATSRLETDRLTQLKAKAGFEAPANAALAAAAAAEARTRVTTQRAENDVSVKALVALTALSEKDVRARLASASGRLAIAPSLVLPSVPASLLADRADLRSIERELAAAIAEIGAAEADRYPKISLTGSIGYSASRAFGATSDGVTWGFGPLVSIPLFDAGRRAANVELAKARHAELTANYRATALRAVREVEEALTRIESVKERESDQRSALANYEAFEKAAQARLLAGVGSVLELEDARRAVLAAQVNVLSLERERATAWVALFRAVGGDWQQVAGTASRVALVQPVQ